jgi:hypothetical protein
LDLNFSIKQTNKKGEEEQNALHSFLQAKNPYEIKKQTFQENLARRKYVYIYINNLKINENYNISYKDTMNKHYDYDFQFPKHGQGETVLIFVAKWGGENNDKLADDVGEYSLNYFIRNYQRITMILGGGGYFNNMDFSNILKYEDDEVDYKKGALYIKEEKVEEEGELANLWMKRMTPFTRSTPFMVNTLNHIGNSW